MSNARQEILDRLKNAVHRLPEKPDFNAPVYHSINKPLELAFKENLENVNGSVHLFDSEKELFKELQIFLSKFDYKDIFCREDDILKQLKAFRIPFSESGDIIESLEVGITGCEYLIAHTGSAMVSSAQKGGRQLFAYSPVHIIIARKDQVVDYLDKAYAGIQKKYRDNLPSQITLITGPSRTADIEKTLILGAHGPRELNIFLLND